MMTERTIFHSVDKQYGPVEAFYQWRVIWILPSSHCLFFGSKRWSLLQMPLFPSVLADAHSHDHWNSLFPKWMLGLLVSVGELLIQDVPNLYLVSCQWLVGLK